MNGLLSRRVIEMEESATIKMAEEARRLNAQGIDVISLSLGEPDFITPVFVREAAKRALDEGYTKYTPVPGLMELREAISNKFKNENGLNYEPNQIVVSNGAKQCVANIAQALLNKGDQAIIFAPYWVSYKAIIEMAGGTAVLANSSLENDFKVSPEALDHLINDKTKFVLFSSPCNPTGSVYSRSELESISKVILKYPNLIVVSDEIYEYINFESEHFSIGSLPGMLERTATVNGFSKGFAMTGWRLGYMGAPSFLAKACTKIQGQFTSGASSFGQKAAADSLKAERDEVERMKKAFKERRDLVISLIDEMPDVKSYVPTGAFYILPDISSYFGSSFEGSTIKNSDDFCSYILKEGHVALVPGTAFGADNCVRISYASSKDELKEAMKRIKNALSKLS